MIKRILSWLISIYFKPAPAETPTPGVTQMTDQVVDVAQVDVATSAAAPVQPAAAVQPTAVEEVKAGVADFEKALAFVERGVAEMGEAAKDELKALAKKYL